MKHIVTTFAFLLLFLSGCSSEDFIDEDATPAINLKGEVRATSNEETRAGPINALGTYPITLLRADMNTAVPPKYTTWGSKSNATLETAGSITNSLYYLSQRNRSTKLTGFYPQSGTWTTGANTITFSSLKGDTDVMCSKFVDGNKDSPMTSKSMEFNHMLSQIVLKIKCASNATTAWGNVTGATLKGVAPNVVVTIPAPTATTASVPTSVANGTATTNSLVFTNLDGTAITAAKPTTTAKDFGCVMFPPVTGGTNMNNLTLTIHTADGDFPATIPSSLITDGCKAGTSYTLTLEFTVTGITTKATIAKWVTSDRGTITIN